MKICIYSFSDTLILKMPNLEPIDTNCMTLTRWILGEQRKYAPPGQSSGRHKLYKYKLL